MSRPEDAVGGGGPDEGRASASPTSRPELNPDARALAEGGAVRLVSSAVGLAAGFATSVVLVRTLGVSDYGSYAFVMSLVGLLGTVAGLGVGAGISRMSSYLGGAEGAAWARTARRACTKAGTALSLVALALVAAVPEPIVVPLMLGAPLVLAVALSSAETGYLASERRIWLIETTTTGVQIVSFVALGVLTLADALSPATAVLAQLAVRGAAAVIQTVSSRRSMAHYPRHEEPPTRGVLRFTLPLMLSSAATVVLARSDVVLLGLLSNRAETGSYAPVVHVFDASLVFVAALGYYFVPVASALVRRGDDRRLQEAYASLAKWIAVVTMPLLIPLAVLPVPIFTTVYGPAFAGTAQVAAILSVGYLVNVVTGTNGSALVALGATRQVAVRSAVVMLLNVVLNIALIPALGATGAALGTAISMTLLNLWNAVLVWRLRRLHAARRDNVVVLGGVAAAAAVALTAVHALGWETRLLGSAVVAGSVAAAGLGLGLATLTDPERSLLRGFLMRPIADRAGVR